MKMGKFSSCRADRGVRPYIIIIIFMWSRQLFAAFVGIVHHLRHALPQPRVGRQRLRREGGAAAVVGVPLCFVLRDTAGNSGATLGMMSVMLPMFFLAMYQKNGQPAEKILRYYLQARYIRPKVRPYQTRNYYALLVKGDDAHDSVSEKE